VLVALTFAQQLLRLRRPRPPLHEIVRQSGMVVCLGMSLATIVDVDIIWMTGTDVISPFLPMFALVLFSPLLGAYPWKAEPSWIDRLGRAIGWGWIIVIGCEYVIEQRAYGIPGTPYLVWHSSLIRALWRNGPC
jgi:hypothetical protein